MRPGKRKWVGIVLLLACACTTVLMSFGSMCGTKPYGLLELRPSSSSSTSNDLVMSLLSPTTPTRNESIRVPEDGEKTFPNNSSLPSSQAFKWKPNEYTSYCYYVEDICRSSHRWFYRPHPHKRQPNLIWDTLHPDEWPVHSETIYKRYYPFRRQPPVLDRPNGTAFIATECTTSPVTNHLVLYGVYNDMLGEFYDRTLLFLDALRETQNWVIEDTQMYLHLYRPYKPLMDSHHLFTAPWRSKPLLSVVELLDDATCQCLPRLIMCGYDVRNASATEVAASGIVPTTDATAASATTIASNSTAPAASATVVLVRPGAGWDSKWKTRNRSDRYKKVRNRLRSTLVDKNPHVQEDALKFRNVQFDRLNIPHEDRPNYRLVGLAQRNGRRRWRDLSALQNQVQEQLLADRKYVALVEMNVEVDSSSYQQLVRHAALDGYIGIHGAQLTEAVWMKDGSWVVELLPYAPPYVIMGHWTRTVHEATPVGVMFHRTGLNHAGYRIPIELTPYCHHNVSDEDCWRANMWDGRDFTLSPAVLIQMLDAFFPSPSEAQLDSTSNGTAVTTGSTGPTTVPLCSDLQVRSNGTFVLYNVHCADEAGGPAALRHFYWPCDRC